MYLQKDDGATQKLNASRSPIPASHRRSPSGALLPGDGDQGVQARPRRSPASRTIHRPAGRSYRRDRHRHPPGSSNPRSSCGSTPALASGRKIFPGNGNHGNLGSAASFDSHDPSWVTGPSRTALQFDGVDDYFFLIDIGSLDLEGSFTFEAWVRREPGTKSTVVNKGESGSRTLRVSITSTGAIEFVWDTRTGTARSLSTANIITDSAWHHVACVYDQTLLQNRAYVDGILRKTAVASGAPAMNAKPLYIGVRPTTTLNEPLRGAVDQLRLTPQVLYTASFAPLNSPIYPQAPAGRRPQHSSRLDATSQWWGSLGYRVYSRAGARRASS